MSTSQFLLNKITPLKNTIEFYGKGSSSSLGIERKLIFLSQIDFWDFEMDSLLFAFDSFQKRQESWNGSTGIVDGLKYNNILVKSNVLDKHRYSLGVKMEAPIVELNELIDIWNTYLDRCSSLLPEEKQIQATISVGGASEKTLLNLHKFKKEYRK